MPFHIKAYSAMLHFLLSPGTVFNARPRHITCRSERIWREPAAELAQRVGNHPITEPRQCELERSNMEAALKAADGRLFGKGGAAELLGLKPTTLASRLKRLEIKLPD